jgi:hypothetical protein
MHKRLHVTAITNTRKVALSNPTTQVLRLSPPGAPPPTTHLVDRGNFGGDDDGDDDEPWRLQENVRGFF